MSKRENFFQKVTRLFKSGPVIKRKVRGFDTTLAMPDKTKSSAALIFQKSLSPTYATITGNAYNIGERMARYQDYVEMEMCLEGNTLIAVPNGYKTIAELASECEKDPNKQFIVYAYDHNTKTLTPAFAKQARHTVTAPAWKVTFDNGKSIIGTANHRLMLRDGTYRVIEDLKPGDAMMPFYRKDLYANNETSEGYRWVYTMDTSGSYKGWTVEHRLIAEWVAQRKLNSDEVVHHINFVKHDNTPENLMIMTNEAHCRYHCEILNGKKWAPENSEWIEKFKRQHSEWMKANNPATRHDITFARILETCERQDVNFNTVKLQAALDTSMTSVSNRLLENGFKNFETFAKAYNPEWKNAGWDNKTAKNPRYDHGLTFEDVCRAYKHGMTKNELAKTLNTTHVKMLNRLKHNGFKTFTEFSQTYQNHTVSSIEYHGVIPLYDLTVDGYKNFATDTVISHNTPEIAAALDIYSDETVSQDDKGNVLHVFSDNEKIKQLLEDLFYDTLNVDFNLRSWVRNVPVRGNTAIPLLDGSTMTIRDIANEMKRDPDWIPWVYSVQDDNNALVPGKVTWCDMTREGSKLVRLYLDDETYVDCTSDHEWVLRDGTRKKACDLSPGDSMMPFYRRVSSKSTGDELEGYELVYDPSRNDYRYTHRVIVDDETAPVIRDREKGVTHHVDFDKRNNEPTNLRVMNWEDHVALHARHCKDTLHTPEVTKKRMIGIDRWLRSPEHRDLARQQLVNLQAKGLMRTSWAEYNSSDLHKEHNVIRSAASRKLWSERREEISEKLRIRFDDKCLDLFVECLKEHNKYVSPVKAGELLKRNEAFMKHFCELNAHSKRDVNKSLNSSTGIASLLSKVNVTSYIDLIDERLPDIAMTSWFKRAKKKSERLSGIIPVQLANHKIVAIEHLAETDDVYCMEVVGNAGQHDRHNFMVLTRDKEGNVASSGICSQNCKYGDMFLLNDVHPDYGVVNAIPIPVNEIQREENYDSNDPFAVRFRWTSLNRILENWEVSHFRLLGNDSFLPYGSSIVEPARRIWRQLILIEDAMLVYRVVRAPERRVFYIDVANIAANDIPAYMEEQKKSLRTNQVVDKNSGRIDLRYNPLCFRGVSQIPLLDGRTISIKDLVNEWNTGKHDHEVYSLDLEKGGRIVPGKVIWAGKSGTTTQFAKITLDDGGVIEVTPDHKMMLRDGNPVKARDLNAGDSLMPSYTKYMSMTGSTSHEPNKSSYEMILNPENGTYYFTHRIVAAKKYDLELFSNGFISQKRGTVVHHVNFNKLDNTLANLQLMKIVDHTTLHAITGKENLIKYNKSEQKRLKTIADNRKYKKAQKMGERYNGSELHEKHNENRREGQYRSWSNPDKHIERCESMRYKWSDECQAYVINVIRSLDKFEGLEAFLRRLKKDQEFLQIYGSLNSHLDRDPSKSLHKFLVGKFITKDYANWKGVWASHHPSALGRRFINNVDPLMVVSEGSNNHKVVSVELIDVKEDVYNITVDEYHNLTIQAQNCHGTNMGKVQSFQSVDEDYFIPVRGQESGTKIDTLSGGNNVAAVEDVAYFQKKLFAALKVPRAYLGYDDMLSCLVGNTQIPLLDGTTISIEELAKRNNFDDVYVYSCDTSTHQIKAGKVVKAWKTKDITKVHRVTLDDGTIIQCTENHPFLCRDGTYKRADELKQGQPLMPLYRKLSTSKKNGGDDLLDGYEMILNTATGTWEYTHKIVNEHITQGSHVVSRQRVVHHVDFDKLNNNPENLVEMTWHDHRKLHAHNLKHTLLRPDVIEKREPARLKALKSQKHRDKKSVQMKAQHADPDSAMSRWTHGAEISEVVSCVMKDNWKDPEYRLLKTKQNNELWERKEYSEKYRGDNHWSRRKKLQYDIAWLITFCKEHNVVSIKEWNGNHPDSVANISPVGISYVNSLLDRSGYDGWRDFAKRELNLDVSNCGPRRGKSPYSFTNPLTGERENMMSYNEEWLRGFCVQHNVTSERQFFPTNKTNVLDKCPVKTARIKRVLKEAGGWETFKKTIPYNHKIVSIEVINLDVPIPVYDLEVEEFHNFAISDEQRTGSVFVHNSKSTLAQEDIRFSRTIAVIQKTVLAELNKLAIIHLYANGMTDDDLVNFTLHLSNPSTVAQQQKLELWRAKFEIAGSMPEGMGSKTFAYKNIWGLADNEIKEITRDQASEARIAAKLEGMGAEEGGAPGGGGGGGGDLFGGAGGEPAGDDPGGGDPGDAEMPDFDDVASDVEDAEPEPDAEEEPENAGEEPDEELEPGLELLMSSDDPDDDELPSLEEDEMPKPQAQLKHALYNRSRLKHSGPEKMHTPNFLKSTKPNEDPNGMHDLKMLVSDPLGESTDRKRRKLGPDVMSALRNIPINLRQKVIIESVESDDADEDLDIVDDDVEDT